MTKSEATVFIETMEEVGDIWTEEQVLEVYKDCSLENAISDRKSSLGIFFDLLGKIL